MRLISILIVAIASNASQPTDSKLIVQRTSTAGIHLELGIQSTEETADHCFYAVEFSYSSTAPDDTVIELVEAPTKPPVPVEGHPNRFTANYVIERGQSVVVKLEGSLKNQQVAHLDMSLNCEGVGSVDTKMVEDDQDPPDPICACVAPNIASEDGWTLVSDNCWEACSRELVGCEYECTQYDLEGEIVGEPYASNKQCFLFGPPCCKGSHWSIEGDGEIATLCQFVDSICTVKCVSTCEYSGTLIGQASPTTIKTKCSY